MPNSGNLAFFIPGSNTKPSNVRCVNVFHLIENRDFMRSFSDFFSCGTVFGIGLRKRNSCRGFSANGPRSGQMIELCRIMLMFMFMQTEDPK